MKSLRLWILRTARSGMLALAAVIACAAIAPDACAAEPMRVSPGSDFFRRALTLPGATLQSAPGPVEQPGAALPVFSIFYVFGSRSEDGKEWLEVGRQVSGPPEGWIEGQRTQDWSTMLVMQYAPAGQRRRVLFFEEQTDLNDVLQGVDPVALVDRLERDADSGSPTNPSIVAIEPPTKSGVPVFENRPYLMPVSGHRQTRSDDGTAVTMLRIASLNSTPPKPSPAPEPTRLINAAVVFVIDTTISMQPFIEQVQAMVARVYDDLERDGVVDRVTFGLVGFRNNMDSEPQRSKLEYVTKIYQDLNPNDGPDQVLASIKTVKEASVSTHSFDEDAVAGLYTAIERLNWDPFDARLLVFISDAGALGGNDPRGHFPGVDLLNIREAAERRDIAIFPIHLRSELGIKANDVEKARAQYDPLGRTGDVNASKYCQVDASSPTDFQQKVGDLGRQLATAIGSKAPIAKVEVPESAATGRDLGRLLVNELFNAQMRYIGKAKETQAPAFFEAWASDKDLAKPTMQALQVSVFLTRNQLNEMALALKRIVDHAKSATIEQSSFFSLLRSLAAATIQDPDRYRAKFETIADSNLLPSYLTLLPYRSDILQMSEDRWKSMGKTEVEQVIDRLAFKLRAYQDIYQDTGNWRDLGANDPGQAVSAVPLAYLP